MVFAAELGRIAGTLDDAAVDRHRRILESLTLPTTYPVGRWKTLLATMQRDKKARAGMMRFIVLEEIGKPTTLAGPGGGAAVRGVPGGRQLTIGQALAGFALLAAVLTIIPGLDTALVLRATLAQGRRHAIATALGICSGAFVWGAAAAVGATALLAASELAFTVLKLAGAVYLVALGITMFVRTFQRRERPVAPLEAAPRSLWAAYGRGALTNLLNPKVGVFYIAVIPQFIPEGVPALPMGLLLALVHVLESVVWFSAIILATGFARRWLAGERARRWIDRVTGGILVGFGVALALESRQLGSTP